MKDLLVIGTDLLSACGGISGAPIQDRGRVAYPTFTSLAPAGEPQVHAGTYLGRETPSRLNVGVYNDSGIVAVANIEVRRHCDDALLKSISAEIPPNTIVQLPVYSGRSLDEGCGFYRSADGNLGGPPGALYTVVTVDKPSFSYVANVIDSQAAVAGIVISPP